MTAQSPATRNEPPEPQRPDLHVVRDTDIAESVGATGPDTEAAGDADAETPVETTGPLPVLDAEGNPVAAKAPFDVRARDALLRGVHGIPAFGRVPASFAESIAYSQYGDWAASDNGVKRVLHGLATVLAYVVTYPLVEGLGKAREKPIGLVIVLAVLYALARIFV